MGCHFEPFFNESLSFLEICNSNYCKSYIFSDTNLYLLKQNNDVVSEYTMHILSSDFVTLNFVASRFVNMQSFALLDHMGNDRFFMRNKVSFPKKEKTHRKRS